MNFLEIPAEIKKLRAIRWQNMEEKQNRDDWSDGVYPLERRPGASTTSDVELLRLEAEMVDDGTELGNPHIPVDLDTLASAKEAIKQDGNDPAWQN